MTGLTRLIAATRALGPSADSHGRRARLSASGTRVARPHRRGRGREQGVALVVVLTAVAILSVLVADMQENTSTAYLIATTERDQLQAEYMAKSGLNLTRLLVAQQRVIGRAIAPIYQMVLGHPPPDLPVWKLAPLVLTPFCNYDAAAKETSGTGIDLGTVEGLGKTPARCKIVAFAENSKINVNKPLKLGGDAARRSVAMQMFALMGGYQSPSPYDPLFANPDPDGLTTSRLDLISATIDWWDVDTDRTLFDPGAATVTTQGSEQDVYSSFRDPYHNKNAPFDSLQELRLVRGVSDDFWSTFVEPNPDDPDSRVITIYGSGSVNVNEAPPQVLLARICSYLEDQSLCADPVEAAKFIQIMSTIRSLFPLPLFGRVSDFLDFIGGKGGPHGLYTMLQALLGPNNPLLFRPVTIPNAHRTEIDNTFVTAARIITIEATGFVPHPHHGSSGDEGDDEDTSPDPSDGPHVRLRSVVNFDQLWTPPPPNAGRMPSLGIFHYYRVD